MKFEKDVLLAGKFRLERELSHGGMGSIWVAQHVQLGTLVAVKFMRDSYSRLPVLRARFEREARAAAQLKSPHIVQVHDFGFEEEDEVPYLVMELLQGEDLSKRLQRCGRLSLPETLHIIVQAGKALRSVHEAGFVHRDLKPANFFLARVDGEDGEIVKLLDFGIAKDVSAVLAADISATGEVMGSPNYMSPEQFYGERDVDARSDLWSLGVILFYGVTGELPFQGAQLGAVIANILVGPVPSASLIAPDLPPEIDAFFARALARERAERFQSIGEMMGELRRIAGTASPSIPDLQSPCSGVPSTARPRLSGTIALDAAQLDEPASAPRSAGPGTLTIAGSTAQEAGQQRPQRAMLVAGIAMTMLLGAGVTIAVGGGGTSGGDGVGAKVASAGAPASEEVAASASAEVGRSSEPLESVTPAVPAAEATGSAADVAGETAAPSTSTTAARPPSSATPRPPHTGVPAPARRPPIPPTTTPGLDRAPIPEVPF